jgi:regulator of sigma E protease
MGSLFSFAIGLALIAIMITVHETGHFLAAKAVGVTVETFAIGWGKAVKRWYSKGVEYRINIFPLGGYCQLKGGDSNEAGSLFAVSPLKRIVVFLAGPLFNILLAILILTPFFMLNYEEAVFPNKIVISSDYPLLFSSFDAAQKGGLKTGDTIIAINGHKVEDFDQIQTILAKEKKGSVTTFKIIRDNKELEFSFEGIYDTQERKMMFGISYFLEPIVGYVEELSPEQLASLKVDDKIVAAQGKAVYNTFDLLSLLEDNPSLVTFDVIDKNGIFKQVTFLPQKGQDGNFQYYFSFKREITQKSGSSFIVAFKNSLNESLHAFVDTFRLIPQLFQKNENTIAGPIRISFILGSMRKNGLRTLLHLVGSVSISLAAANCLPIPGLDGGSVLLSLIELIIGKSIPRKLYMGFQSVGLFFLLLLMVFVIGSDLRFLFTGF